MNEGTNKNIARLTVTTPWFTLNKISNKTKEERKHKHSKSAIKTDHVIDYCQLDFAELRLIIVYASNAKLLLPDKNTILYHISCSVAVWTHEGRSMVKTPGHQRQKDSSLD